LYRRNVLDEGVLVSDHGFLGLLFVLFVLNVKVEVEILRFELMLCYQTWSRIEFPVEVVWHHDLLLVDSRHPYLLRHFKVDFLLDLWLPVLGLDDLNLRRLRHRWLPELDRKGDAVAFPELIPCIMLHEEEQ